jgi:hypothetical protein
MRAHVTQLPSGEASRERRSREYGQVGAASELALRDALREIDRIDQRLRALDDVATLHRFGEAEAGLSIAESLGHLLLATSEARTVDRLSRMPGGIALVRTFLELSGAPHQSQLGGIAMTVEQNTETITETPQQAVDEQAIRDRAYELSQSEDAGTADENWHRAEQELLEIADAVA